MDSHEEHIARNIRTLGEDSLLKDMSIDWMLRAGSLGRYSYNFSWLGRPIVQYPQDMVAVQEIIWKCQPDLIVETGIAHGGSLILSASMLALLDLADARKQTPGWSASRPSRKVLGIDIDIRAENREAIEAHFLSEWIEMIESDSTSEDAISRVHEFATDYQRVMVFLDSNHSHEHVLSELSAYANLTSPGCYCIVFDTVVSEMPEELCEGRPWGPTSNPRTAVFEFLGRNPQFEVDETIHDKLQITVARDGFLRRKTSPLE